MSDMTAFERQLSGEIAALMGPVPPVDDAAIFTAITATESPKRRFGSMFSATSYVVAGAIVALFGGFLLAAVLPGSDEQSLPGVGPSASVDAERNPVGSDAPELEQATAAPVTDPRLAGDGPWLRLEVGSEARDAFIEAERDGLLPRRYPDYDGSPTGLSRPWPGEWQAEGFGFKAAMNTTGIDDRPRLRVAVESPDGEVRRQRLGRQESPFPRLRSWGSGGTPAIVMSGTGILIRGEHEGDAVRTWYSADGDGWTERRSWLKDDDMIGTPEGFIRIRGERIHRSADGANWVRVPGTYPDATHLGVRDGDQIFGYRSEDGLRVGRLTDTGIEVFPYSIEAFGSERPDRGTRGDSVAVWDVYGGYEPGGEDGAIPPNLLAERRFTVVGGLGIVHLDRSNRTIVFTPDGTRWSAIAMPEDWLPLAGTAPVGAFVSGAGATDTWVTDDSVFISASVMAPGVGDEQRTEQTYHGTLMEAAVADGSG